jgi:glycosyltransferase involved in cell wall biosynthesis
VPTVSVITTVYGRHQYLRAALAGALGQTVTDLEVLVLVDGADPETLDIAREVAASDPRVSVHALPRVGRGPALNLGLALSRAPYVAILDEDDLWVATHLEFCLDAMRRAGERFAVVASGAIPFTADSDVPQPGGPGDLEDVTSVLRVRNPLRHSAVLMRRSVVDLLGGYSVDSHRPEDYDLFVRMAATGHRLGLLSTTSVGIRQHDERMSGVSPVRSRVRRLVVQREALRSIPGPPMDNLAYAGRLAMLPVPQPVIRTLGRWWR